MSTLHRLEDFGTSKSSVRRCFNTWYDRPETDTWANEVTALLASKRTRFTLSEITSLLDVFNTSHHQCVLENADDYPHLVVAHHLRLEKRIERWSDRLEQMARWTESEPHTVSEGGTPEDAAYWERRNALEKR